MSLRFKLILMVFGPAFLVVGYLYFYYIPKVEQESRRALMESAYSRLDILQAGLIHFLVDDEREYVAEFLDINLAKNPDWVTLALYGEDGDRIYPEHELPEFDRRADTYIRQIIEFQGDNIGRLILVTDFSKIIKARSEESQRLAILFGIISMLGLLFITIVLDRMIRKPVQRLAKAAQSLSSGDYSATLPPPRRDEIGVLVKSFISMRDSVRKNKMDLVEANEELSKQIESHKWLVDAVKESEATLANTQRIASIGSWAWNIPTGRHSWSEEIYRILGCEKHEVQASYEAFIERVHQNDRERVDEIITRSLEKGWPFQTEYRLNRPDGWERYVEIQGEVELDNDRSPWRMVLAVLDITERKKAEAERESLLETITSRLREMGCLYGVTRLLVSSDQSVESVAEQAVYMMPDALQYPESAAVLIEIAGKNYKTDNFWETEWSMVVDITAADKVVGLIHVCYLEEKPEMDEGPFRKEERDLLNALGAQVGAFIDRKWTEERLAHARRKERIAAEELKQTLELSEELRAEAERSKVLAEEYANEARQANRSKSEFLANMSHELRTPLNGIIGLTDLLLSDGVTGELKKKLELIRFSGDTLLALVNDILDLTKIEEGKLELERTDFNVREVIEKTAEQLAVTAHKKKLEFLVSVDSAIPSIFVGDPLRLRQVMVNLIGNAIKFTEKGEILLAAELDSTTSKSAMVHFSVKDTGAGIAKDRQAQVFERFTQEDTSITRKYGGAGLGTTISKQLVDLMGGDIWLESELGEGSVFHFTARFAVIKEAPKRSFQLPANKASLRALLVDGNDTFRGIVKKCLVKWGVEVETASNGKNGHEIFSQFIEEKKPFDILILDNNIPGENSQQIIRKTRSLTGDTEFFIILLNTGQQTGNRRRGDSEADAILEKPLKETELFATIEKFCQPDKKAPEKEGSGATPSPATKSLSILLVEDNVVNQEVARGALARLGHNVTIASDGEEGVEKWDSGSYDIIFMDVQMPVMDGLTATSLIRKKEKKKGGRTTIIAMTANAMTGDRELCLKAGMDDYLPKPVTLAALADKVGKTDSLATSITHEVPRPSTLAITESDKMADEETEDDYGNGSAPIYDLGEIRKLLGGSEEKVKKIAGSFLSTTEKNLTELVTAIEKNDSSLAHRMAHTIKGAASQVGAERMRLIAFDLEALGKAGKLKVIGEKLPVLKEAFFKVKKAMEEEL